MTLEQVKEDIASRKSTRIYYSTGTLWWTHLDEDVQEATYIGRAYMNKIYRQILKNGTKVQKKQVKFRMAMEKKSAVTIPVDPMGYTLYEFREDLIEKWIAPAEKNPDHFGPGGLDTFMKAHHQNCKGRIFAKWSDYEQKINNRKPLI